MTVLMLAQYLELGHNRAEFLKSHGIDVIFAENEVAALRAVQRGGFDLVILSYSLPNENAKELVELIQQSCPTCPLIAITRQRWYDREFNPEATVLATDPPQTLLDAIQKVSRPDASSIRRLK